jgi:hypothetical protein
MGEENVVPNFVAHYSIQSKSPLFSRKAFMLAINFPF